RSFAARPVVAVGLGDVQSSLKMSFRFGWDFDDDTGVTGGDRNNPPVEAGDDEKDNDELDDEDVMKMCDLFHGKNFPESSISIIFPTASSASCRLFSVSPSTDSLDDGK